jgi:hypothetical protein
MRQAVRVLEYLSDRVTSAAAPIALPALAARITGDTKALNHGTALATVVLRALALQAGTTRPPQQLSGGSCGTGAAWSSTT